MNQRYSKGNYNIKDYVINKFDFIFDKYILL